MSVYSIFICQGIKMVGTSLGVGFIVISQDILLSYVMILGGIICGSRFCCDVLVYWILFCVGTEISSVSVQC